MTDDSTQAATLRAALESEDIELRMKAVGELLFRSESYLRGIELQLEGMLSKFDCTSEQWRYLWAMKTCANDCATWLDGHLESLPKLGEKTIRTIN